MLERWQCVVTNKTVLPFTFKVPSTCSQRQWDISPVWKQGASQPGAQGLCIRPELFRAGNSAKEKLNASGTPHPSTVHRAWELGSVSSSLMMRLRVFLHSGMVLCAAETLLPWCSPVYSMKRDNVLPRHEQHQILTGTAVSPEKPLHTRVTSALHSVWFLRHLHSHLSFTPTQTRVR